MLFLINTAATGEPNYQGGDRKTFYSSTGFPFANTWETFENRGQRVATGSVPTEILLNRNTAIVIVWDLMYFVVGRYSGLVPYFFPGVLAALLFLTRRAARQRWQWFVALAVAGGAIGLLAYMPYTYSGGGGPVGNRYFLSFYPLFLFLMPPLRSAWPALIALVIGALFIAKVTLNPFYSSFHPGEHAKAGPLRMLPDRTVAAERSAGQRRSGAVEASPARHAAIIVLFRGRRRVCAGGGFLLGEGGTARRPAHQRARRRDPGSGHGVAEDSDHARRDHQHGDRERGRGLDRRPPRENDARARRAARRRALARPGVPYKPALFPMGYVYTISVSTSAGVTPFLMHPESSDSRYLGARVRIVPLYQDQ